MFAHIPCPSLVRLSNLWLPTLRGVIERNITAVAAGQRTKCEGELAGAGCCCSQCCVL